MENSVISHYQIEVPALRGRTRMQNASISAVDLVYLTLQHLHHLKANLLFL